MGKGSENESVLNNDLDMDISAINTIIKNTIDKHNLSFNQVVELLQSKRQSDSALKIPNSIFTKEFGILESIVKYLKEDKNLTYHKIAVLLNRDDRVIWTTYNNSKKKNEIKLTISKENTWLPISIFSNRKLSPLESISKYCKDELNLNFEEIAKLVNSDSKTIWSAYKRKNG